MLTVQAIPAFKDNYIWLIQLADKPDTIIVDPGDATPVLAAINQRRLKPIALLITHGCHDHINGIETLVKHYPVLVYGPKDEFIPSLTHPIRAPDKLTINPQFPPIQVLATPGHTNDHISFLIEDCLFCGDTLFAGGCGRLHGNIPAELLFNSLQQLASLPAQTKLYCVHEYTETNLQFAQMIEPNNTDIQQRIKRVAAQRQQGKPSLPATLADELKTNPFLRCQQPTVIQAVATELANDNPTALAVFTALRKRKDQF